MLRKSHHRDTGVVIDGTSRLCQVKSCPYDFCIISIGFKKVTHLIQQKATRIVCFGFKIRLIELRQSSILWFFSFCRLSDTLFNALWQALLIIGNFAFRGDMGNSRIVAANLFRSVPYRQTVSEIPKAEIVVLRLFFGGQLHDLQVIVHRVFLHLTVELGSFHLFVEKRELRIVEHHTLIIKVQDLKFTGTEIHLITEVVGILGRLRLGSSFFFGWCYREDFSVPAFLGKLCSAFFLLCQPFGILRHLLGVQVAVEPDQLGNTLLHLTPFQGDVGLITSDTLGNTDALTVVLLINIGSDNSRIDSAPAVFIF